jgi:hypothetical protein
MPKAPCLLALFVPLAVCPAVGLFAEPPPNLAPFPLPAREAFVYSRTIGDRREAVEVETRLVSDQGAPYREVAIRSPDQEELFRLDPETLFVLYSDITTRAKDATIRRVTTVLENRAKPKDDEFLVSGTENLAQSLRFFPWGRRQKAKLAFVGSGGGGNFVLELSVTGREKVAVGGREIECWKAQLGLAGVLGGLMGKTSLWYSTEYPIYMVKSEGPSAGPGSPTSVLELESYSGSDE